MKPTFLFKILLTVLLNFLVKAVFSQEASKSLSIENDPVLAPTTISSAPTSENQSMATSATLPPDTNTSLSISLVAVEISTNIEVTTPTIPLAPNTTSLMTTPSPLNDSSNAPESNSNKTMPIISSTTLMDDQSKITTNYTQSATNDENRPQSTIRPYNNGTTSANNDSRTTNVTELTNNEHSKSATPSSIETSSESNNKGRVEGFSTSNPVKPGFIVFIVLICFVLLGVAGWCLRRRCYQPNGYNRHFGERNSDGFQFQMLVSDD